MSGETDRVKQRPYFIWDYDLTEDDVRSILRGDNEYEKVQMMVRILESARWEDIWQYLTVAEVRRYWQQIARWLRPAIREAWTWAWEMWGYGTT
jgi:hypothetical protein